MIPSLVPCVSLGSSCETGAIRLAGGPSFNEGRVEICYRNVWGAVFDSSWEEYDAAVVCNQLGFDRYSQLHCITVLIINLTLYGIPKNKSTLYMVSFSLGAIPVTGVLYGSSNTLPVSASAPECVGNETSLLECRVRQGSGNVSTNLGETGRYQNDGQDSSIPVGVRCEGKLLLSLEALV